MASLSTRAVRLVLALSVGVASVGHSATSQASAVVVKAADDLDKAKQLYEKGKAKYDTFDYDGAIEMWTEAYAIVPDDAAKTRNLLAYNIATAQEKAYEVDNDVAHLKTAKLLLVSYIANYKAINKATPEAKTEVQKAEDRIASLQAAIEAHEGGGAAPAPAPAVTTEEPPPETPTPPKQEDSPEVAAQKRKAKGLIVGGYASMGVGLAFLVASGISHAVAGVTETTDEAIDSVDGTQDESPTARRARTAGWVLLGAGVAGLVAAGVLLGIGYSKRSKARRASNVAFSPYGTPEGGGAVLRVRF